MTVIHHMVATSLASSVDHSVTNRQLGLKCECAESDDRMHYMTN